MKKSQFIEIVINSLGTHECMATRESKPFDDGRVAVSLDPVGIEDLATRKLIAKTAHAVGEPGSQWVIPVGQKADFDLTFVHVYKAADCTSAGAPKRGAKPHKRHVVGKIPFDLDDSESDELAAVKLG